MPYRESITQNDQCKKCNKALNRPKRLKTGLCRLYYYKTLTGSGNPMFGKRNAKKYYCIDCGSLVSGKAYKRCHSCAGKHAAKRIVQNRRSYEGKNNPNYRNGLSNKPYSLKFNNKLKEKIRKRDRFECKNCGMIEEEHITVLGISLNVHHIDYNKQNCNTNNLITLCQWCNVRANYNRKQWKLYYQEKINALLQSIA